MDLLPTPISPLFPVLIFLALILTGYLAFTGVLELVLACRSLARHLRTMFGFLFGSTGKPELERPPRRKRRPENDARFVIPMTAPSPGYYLGIVNMSGTFCFLNSVLQALSSLTPFLEHLSALSDLAIRTDTPTPLLSTFLPVLFQLLTPSPTKYPRPLRPTELVEALRQSDTVKRSGMFGRLRDQQDAQELWVLLNGCVEEERVAIEKNDKSSKLGIKGKVRQS